MQGKSEAAAKKLLEDAKAVEEAGAFAVVIEGVPAKIAALITEQLHIPTIGIGAGKDCDGQVLVYQDMLGMFSDFTPKFVKRYANIGEVMKEAFQNYIKEVRATFACGMDSAVPCVCTHFANSLCAGFPS